MDMNDDLEDVTVRSTTRRHRKKWFNYLPSTSSVLLTLYLIISLLMNGGLEPLTRRGFFCDDTSLTYPFEPDTVGFKTLIFVALIIPGAIIKFCDRYIRRLLMRSLCSGPVASSYKRKTSGFTRELDINSHDTEIDELMVNSDDQSPHSLAESVKDVDVDSNENLTNGRKEESEEEVELFTRIPLDDEREKEAREQQVKAIAEKLRNRTPGDLQQFFFGLFTCMMLTGLGKMAGGRLRPHFFQRCQPNVDCSLPANANKYFIDFECTNEQLGSRGLAYITTSWPSGHATISFHSMIYLIIYLNTVIPTILHFGGQKVQRRFVPMVLYSSNVLMLGMALYISLTRVSDYHHHPFDVLSGTIIGALTAFLSAKFLLNQHYENILLNVK